MKRLLAYQGSVDTPDRKTGQTALHMAARCGFLEVVRVLVQARANLASVDRLQRKPLALAAATGSPATAELLQEIWAVRTRGYEARVRLEEIDFKTSRFSNGREHPLVLLRQARESWNEECRWYRDRHEVALRMYNREEERLFMGRGGDGGGGGDEGGDKGTAADAKSKKTLALPVLKKPEEPEIPNNEPLDLNFDWGEPEFERLIPAEELNDALDDFNHL